MTNDYREPALESASDAEMAKALAELVETGQVSVEVVNSFINRMREETAVQAKVASETNEKQLSPDEGVLRIVKARFDALPQLHEGIQWRDVEKSLRTDSEAMRKLMALDEKGHAMNVFGEGEDEFIFVSAWGNYENVSEDHRKITYDIEGQNLAEKSGFIPNGNAVDIVTAMKVDLADPYYHEKLRKRMEVNGGAWLKTDAATRKTGFAFDGYNHGILRYAANDFSTGGSLRALLRVKKA